MKLLECAPVIEKFEDMAAFLEALAPEEQDLILTEKVLFDPGQVPVNGAQVIFREEAGHGEPSDGMLLGILKKITRPYRRVIGIGGGSVMDLAKLLSLDLSGVLTTQAIQDCMMKKCPVQKRCPVILVPTTCGTGSEVTNVAVLLLESLNVKVGLADPALYAQRAILVPPLLASLPYRPMILSAFDALIHAVESALSPKASELTCLLSVEAANRLLRGFARLSNGAGKDTVIPDFLTASCMAGIAFGNAGCGMVHAMSYPIGGKYHLPHGESNYVVFLPVVRWYEKLEAHSRLDALKEKLADALGCTPEDFLDTLESLMEKLCPRPSLKAIGADDAVLRAFAEDVFEKQQRLLGNAMCRVTAKDIYTVYTMA